MTPEELRGMESRAVAYEEAAKSAYDAGMAKAFANAAKELRERIQKEKESQ